MAGIHLGRSVEHQVARAGRLGKSDDFADVRLACQQHYKTVNPRCHSSVRRRSVLEGLREGDEGAAAHIFQLLLAAEVPIAAFFAIKWLPRFPGQAIDGSSPKIDIRFCPS